MSFKRLTLWSGLVVACWAIAAAANEQRAITTFAGTPNSVDGTLAAARFKYPTSLTLDSSGNIYVADTSNHTIRKILTNGTVITLAGVPGVFGHADGAAASALFDTPRGIAVDSSGNVFVGDSANHVIRKITPGGTVSTYVGQAHTSGTETGSGSAARFYWPGGLAIDGTNTLYVVDRVNGAIRRVSPGGVVTNFAGLPGTTGYANGNGLNARFLSPTEIAIGPGGTLYVADFGNHVIRAITPAGDVSLVAGTPGIAGTQNGPALSATFFDPYGVAVNTAGDVFVSETGDYQIRRISGGTVESVAGLVGVSGNVDASGFQARFASPCGMRFNSSGLLVLCDLRNSTIRQIDPANAYAVTTFAGVPCGANGVGGAARFDAPSAVIPDGNGGFFVADSANKVIRKITSQGTVSTYAGQTGISGFANGPAAAAKFYYPNSLAIDGGGNLYVGDDTMIRVISAVDQTVSTLAGVYANRGQTDGALGIGTFHSITGLALDGSGNVFVADNGNHAIRKVTPGGNTITVAGGLQIAGFKDDTGLSARFYYPWSIAIDAGGNLFVGEWGNQLIRKIAPGYVVTSVAGMANNAGTADGIGTYARFYSPNGIATAAAGNLYVADIYNCTIRKVTPAQTVSTVAGLARTAGTANGTGPAARFNYPSGVALDSSGAMYITDSENGTIRKGVVAMVNFAPTAAAKAAIVREDTPTPIVLAGNDNDDEVVQTLTFAIASQPQHGALSAFNSLTGEVIYTPTANYSGSDAFTFTVTDQATADDIAKTSAAATVTINVKPANDPPTANPQSLTTPEDTPLSITLTGNDGDADIVQTLTFMIMQQPAHGTLASLDEFAGTLVYTPAANFNGSDAFKFQVVDDDSAGDSALSSGDAIVNITITKVNDAPGADAKSLATPEDTAVQITLSGNDGDADATQTLTFAIAAQPAHGILSGLNASSGTVTYTPNSDYNGADSFTYTVTDDSSAGGAAKTSAPAQVSLAVNPVNDLPHADAKLLSTPEDTALAIVVSGDDGDGINQTLTFSIVAQPAHGTLTNFNATAGTATYTPAVNFNGVDSFTFTVTDDATGGTAPLISATASVQITITAVNDAPGADAQSVNVNEDSLLGIILTGTDGDPEVAQQLTFTLETFPQHGTLSDFDAVSGIVAYTPEAGYTGPDSFTFSVSDDDSAGTAPLISIVATVSISANEVNDPPDFASDPGAVPSAPYIEETVTFSAAATDPENSLLTYTWNFGDGAAATGGQVQHAYVQSGTYRVRVTVSDGELSIFREFDVTARTDSLTISKLATKLNFAKQNNDQIQFSGELPVPASTNFFRKVIVFDVGGIRKQFTQDIKGSAKTGGDSLAMKAPKFTTKLTKGNFGASLADDGFVNDNVKAIKVGVPVTVFFDQKVYQQVKAQTYTAKKGKSGSSK